MNSRQSFLETVSFGSPTRVPNYEVGVWEQTWERWFSEGLPRDVIHHLLPTGLFMGEPFFGLDRRDYAGPNLRMLPEFEETVLEETERHVVYQDTSGVVRKALKEGTVRGWRTCMDQFLRFPVGNRDDFLGLLKRYKAHSPIRYPLDWEDRVAIWKDRDYVVCAGAHDPKGGSFGLYSRLRLLMGTEGVSVAFYDQPELIDEMLDFFVDFFIETTRKAFSQVRMDYFQFFEDFAYKGAPLFSPEIFRRFFMPRYKKLIGFMRGHGVEFFFVDSDGDPSALLPLMIESGINGLWPMERAAGVDPHRLRKEYGRSLVLSGGIDKQALTQGRRAIDQELRSVAPLMQSGGYIPTVDHLVSPDLRYSDFLYYLEQKEKLLSGEL